MSQSSATKNGDGDKSRIVTLKLPRNDDEAELPKTKHISTTADKNETAMEADDLDLVVTITWNAKVITKRFKTPSTSKFEGFFYEFEGKHYELRKVLWDIKSDMVGKCRHRRFPEDERPIHIKWGPVGSKVFKFEAEMKATTGWRYSPLEPLDEILDGIIEKTEYRPNKVFTGVILRHNAHSSKTNDLIKALRSKSSLEFKDNSTHLMDGGYRQQLVQKDNEVNRLKQEYEASKHSNTLLQEEKAELKTNLEATKKNLTDTKKNLTDTKKNLTDTKKNLTHTKKNLTAATQEASRLKEEYETEKMIISKTKEENTELKTKLEATQNKLAELINEKYQSESEELERKMRREQEELEQKIRQQQEEFEQQMRQQMEELERSLREKKEELERKKQQALAELGGTGK
ncbi:hypothetical protein V8F06_010273 [Rhypophila decipiens]